MGHRNHLVALRLNAISFPRTTTENALFDDRGVEVIPRETLDANTSANLLSRLDALLVVSASIREEVIAKLDQCRVISRYGTGTDNVDVAAATRRGIVVTNVPDFCLSEVAEHTLALLLGVARKLLVMDRATRNGNWQARVKEPVRRIAGRRLGLVGFGNIARQVAARARAFGLDLVACDPFLNTSAAAALSVRPVSFQELLETSDFVSLHVPLTSETRHMIGEAELRSMMPCAVLINTARGALIDERALVIALSEGWIDGAGVDVYEELSMFDVPPAFKDHPLFGLSNVLLSPHTAACSEDSLEQLMRDGAKEACTVLAGNWPAHCVNRDVTPRFTLAPQ